MKTTIIGLGLMGGSLALQLRQSYLMRQTIGVDNNPEHLQEALRLGIVKQTASLSDAITEADLIILAVPVDVASSMITNILDRIKPDAVVTDLGSVKGKICHVVDHHKNRGRFVAAHPIAGAEKSGPHAARNDLFKNETVALCETEKSDYDAIQIVEGLFRTLKMNITYMTAADHDQYIAYTSHLSHVVALAHSLTVMDAEHRSENIYSLAGSGFKSSTRLAKGSPDMWSGIYQENNKALAEALTNYLEVIGRLKDYIEREDTNRLSGLMKKANGVQNLLNTPQHKTLLDKITQYQEPASWALLPYIPFF